MSNRMRAVIPIAVALIFWLMPVPEGLTPNAMRFLGIFLGVILALILEPLPNAAVGLIGVTLAGALQLVPLPDGRPAGLGGSLNWVLSGFVDGVVWLIFIAFMFGLGYEKSGLGKRIALILINKLGKKALGLGYAAALSDLVLAPFTPSNTARSGGMVYPVFKNIPPMYGSLPDNEPRKIGGYLMWTCFTATNVTASMFLTGLAPNLLALSLIGRAPGVTNPAAVTVTWMEWFLSVAPAGIVLFLMMPLLAYILYPPTQKVFLETPKWAAGELEKLGPTTRKEWMMAALGVLALTLWIFGGQILNATMVGLVVFCLMLVLNIITWDDVISNKSAWNTFVWFATLVAMASGLARVGFLTWLAGHFGAHLTEVSPETVLFILLAAFYFSHYFFASLTAHVTALMPVFLATAATIPDLNLKLFGMMLAGSLGIMGVITPYATGPAPIYYNTGYIKRAAFWGLGTVYGLISFVIYAAVAMYWFPVILGPAILR